MQAYTAEREAEFAKRQAESMVGQLVTFNDCVGYVDSVEEATYGYVANVVALRRKPGTWQSLGNPSIDAQCYRAPVSIFMRLVADPRVESVDPKSEQSPDPAGSVKRYLADGGKWD